MADHQQDTQLQNMLDLERKNREIEKTTFNQKIADLETRVVAETQLAKTSQQEINDLKMKIDDLDNRLMQERLDKERQKEIALVETQEWEKRLEEERSRATTRESELRSVLEGAGRAESEVVTQLRNEVEMTARRLSEALAMSNRDRTLLNESQVAFDQEKALLQQNIVQMQEQQRKQAQELSEQSTLHKQATMQLEEAIKSQNLLKEEKDREINEIQGFAAQKERELIRLRHEVTNLYKRLDDNQKHIEKQKRLIRKVREDREDLSKTYQRLVNAHLITQPLHLKASSL